MENTLDMTLEDFILTASTNASQRIAHTEEAAERQARAWMALKKWMSR
jgi:hypothetical protein